ncbi:hypothetical protein AVEN_953-1 [Araneus ventricosus]|uniref:Uncharacterized protein n=1 Tax=Araneus ventricosus TaxID=182803 RepID=A0A4Y2CXU9_ARAVE|nr:hypothetical protein AVEN_953-1 [Araneus ventricosus]
MLKCDRCRYVGDGHFLALEEIGAGKGSSFEDEGNRCSRGSEVGDRHVVCVEWPVNDLPKSVRSPPICSNPFGGLLSRQFPFSAHKIWYIILKSYCASCTYEQPEPLSSLPPGVFA